jgi:hypothetical protein
MKKQLVLMAFAAMLSITAANAQGGGGGQRMTPEERTKMMIEKMAPLKLDADTKAKADVIIADFNRDSQKAMDELRASGADRDAMQAKRKEFADARDAKLKLIFNEAQGLPVHQLAAAENKIALKVNANKKSPAINFAGLLFS